MKRLRIAIVESPNPIDLFEQRSEAQALGASCKLMGHQTVSFLARSRRELQETIEYLSTADAAHAGRSGDRPLVLHLSCHGHDKGVTFGTETISWHKLADYLVPLMQKTDYPGPLALSLSSCDAAANRLSTYITSRLAGRDQSQLPKFIFSTEGKVNWDDALVAWNLLYLKLSKVGIEDRDQVKLALDDVFAGTKVAICYSRWDSKTARYRRHRAGDTIR